jgi:hypothetical protein
VRALAAYAAADVRDDPIEVKLRVAHAWGMTFEQCLLGETEDAWLRCIELAARIGNADFQLRALWGLAVYLIYTGRHVDAVVHLDTFGEIATRDDDGSAVPDGERLRETAELYAGDLAGAKRRLDSLAIHHSATAPRLRMGRFQLDRSVADRCSRAPLLWLTGFPDQAAEVAAEAVESAVAIGHGVSLCNALALAALPVAL